MRLGKGLLGGHVSWSFNLSVCVLCQIFYYYRIHRCLKEENSITSAIWVLLFDSLFMVLFAGVYLFRLISSLGVLAFLKSIKKDVWIVFPPALFSFICQLLFILLIQKTDFQTVFLCKVRF